MTETGSFWSWSSPSQSDWRTKCNPDERKQKEEMENHIDVLGLPKNATSRLCKLKLAQIEVETKEREKDLKLVRELEKSLKEETDKYLTLKQTVDKTEREKVNVKKEILTQTRGAQFFKQKLDQLDKSDLGNLKLAILEIKAKRNKLRDTKKSLEEFQDLEPTNEALQRKIDELRKIRLSFDLTFVDDSMSSSRSRDSLTPG